MRTASRRFATWAALAGLAALPALAAGCGSLRHDEHALSPAGPQAGRIATLTWWFIGVCIGVYVLTMGFTLFAFLHRRGAAAADRTPVTEPDPRHERRMWTVVSGATGLTVVILLVLMVGDFATGRAIHKFGARPGVVPVRVRVIGHQWWWEVRYDDWPDRFGERTASNIITGANEIHVPVDPANPVPVQLELTSNDVIHSFWVPNLHGKKDLVPGHPVKITLAADKTGTYWGECAEYCGYQHANMRLVVVAEPVEQFHAWLDAQRKEAPAPKTDVQKLGRDVFLGTIEHPSACVMCHAVQGTEARGRVGPDLTHVASRKVLAAGAIPNTPGHLAGWVVDPQKIKPGCRMPQNNLTPEELRALLEYLETLK